MKEEKRKKNKQILYKKAIGICVVVTVAVYCIPELQEILITLVEFLKDEWRERK